MLPPLLYPNVYDVGYAIQNLFGERVELASTSISEDVRIDLTERLSRFDLMDQRTRPGIGSNSGDGGGNIGGIGFGGGGYGATWRIRRWGLRRRLRRDQRLRRRRRARQHRGQPGPVQRRRRPRDGRAARALWRKRSSSTSASTSARCRKAPPPRAAIGWPSWPAAARPRSTSRSPTGRTS